MQALWLVEAVLRRDIFQPRSGHRKRAGHKEEQQHAETVDIAAHRRRTSGEKLGGQIDRRAGQFGGVQGIERRRDDELTQLAAHPEIHQHETPTALSHDVLRLDVPMQQAGAMDR